MPLFLVLRRGKQSNSASYGEVFQVIRLGALATLFWILDGRQETPSIPQFETRGES